MRTRLTFLISLSLVLPVLAQEEAASQTSVAPVPAVVGDSSVPAPAAVVTEPAVVAPSAAVPMPAASPVATALKNKDTSDVDFPDEEIRVILRNVADLYELNLVVPDTLQGRTSLKLREVTWRQMFQVILSPVGYTFIEDGNIVKVVALNSLNNEPVMTEMIKLNSMKPAVLADALKTFIDDKAGEKIQAIPESNFIVLTATPTRFTKLRETIETVDRPNSSKALLSENDVRQILIETKFIEVNTGDAKDIGVNWASLQNYSLGASSLKKGYTSTHDKTNGSTGSTTNSFNQQDSTDFVYPNGGSPVTNLGYSNTTGATNGTSKSVADSTSVISTGVFSAGDFNLILSALQRDTKTRLISNPTLVTYNGRESTLHVGDEIPVSGGGSSTAQGGTQKNEAKRIKSGIILNFSPQIVTVHPDQGDAKEVKLKDYEAIRLDLSKPSTRVNVEGAAGGITLRNKTGDKLVDGSLEPIFTTRSVSTEVVLKDGYTMGIGGMVESSTTNAKTQVPVLGSIPFLGRLFRSDSNDTTNRNLLVFITAKIIKQSETPEQLAKRLRQEDEEAKLSDFVVRGTINPSLAKEIQVQRSDLPGFRENQEAPFYVPPPPTAAEIKAANKAAAKAKKDEAAAQKARAEALSAKP
jgi:type IV pilus assembly protein PilQ